MASQSPQRAYRAPCPGCGAPVDFLSAQSTHAVCGYCRSTVVRDGEKLSRIGKMAELFDDHSPLQLQTRGTYDKVGFVLVGRLQYKSGSGTWTEWNAFFDDGRTGTLGEDNGSYVFSFPSSAQREVPAAERFRVGATTAIGGKPFSVAASEQVALISAQGELPKLPPIGQTFAVVELRSAEGEVISIDYFATPPLLSRGVAVLLEGLNLSGLRDDNVKDEKGRNFECPNCGSPVEVQLGSSKSITCRSCNSLIDLTQGTGGQLAHALQDEPVQLLIPLGTAGQLQGAAWQVVGFQHRMGHDPQDEDEEHFGWNEYLLFNQKRGFLFLVDSEEGWSVVKPTTGAPTMTGTGQSASYLGTTYKLKYSYNAETTYVAGEFYWPVVRGQKTSNRDFASGNSLLSMEQTPTELTWSSGSKIDSDAVAKAFKIEDKKELLKRVDAAPATGKGIGCITIIVVLVVILLLLAVLRGCSCDPQRENCTSSNRSSAGSYGGFSGSGGGGK
ncbi:MAG: DUF4178 domain-containing protein [Burkholderiaceae bacterium]